MTKVSNLFLLVVAVTLALYGSAKGYLYYKAHDLFQNVREQSMPFGDLSYGGISTSIAGKLFYNDIAFTSSGDRLPMTIKNIAFETPNLFYLIGAFSGSGGKSSFPEQLQLRIEDLRINTTSSLMVKLDQMVNEAMPGLSTGELICDKEIVGPEQYRALGYKEITTDLQMGYHYYRDKSLVLSAVTNSDGAMNTRLSIYLKDVPALEVKRALSRLPTISKVDLLYEDVGYTARVNQYCANFKSMSVDEYVIAAANQSDAHYLERWGFAPGHGLRWAYRTFLTNPGKLHIVARPPESLELANLVRYSPANIPALLDMSVEVNGVAIDDLTINAITVPSAAKSATTPPLPSQSDWQAAAPIAHQESGKNQQAPSHKYRQVDMSELKNHADKKVRIVLDSGAIREGWLVEVAERDIKIEQRHYRNAVSMLVERKDIDYVEVQ